MILMSTWRRHGTRRMIMPQNFYELVWIFIIYAFIGWCYALRYPTLHSIPESS